MAKSVAVRVDSQLRHLHRSSHDPSMAAPARRSLSTIGWAWKIPAVAHGCTRRWRPSGAVDPGVPAIPAGWSPELIMSDEARSARPMSLRWHGA